MPTQRDASPLLLVGMLGRTSVEAASRIHEFEPTGPVLKAGPKAALTTERAAASVARY